MANLTNFEKLKLEKIFEMDKGYVLDFFYNDEFQKFVYISVQKDIYDKKYSYFGDSKARRLRAFWKFEPDPIVGKLINDLLEYWYHRKNIKKLMYGEPIYPLEKQLYKECKEIANRLLGVEQKETNQEILTEEDFLNYEFDKIDLSKLGLEDKIISVLNHRINEIEKCLKAKAFLSVIFLCGSVLEGILLGIAMKMPDEFKKSPFSPKKDGNVLPFRYWKLANFIDVAHSIKLLKEDVKKLSHVLKDFRNYIHPYQQLESRFEPNEHIAKICWQVLQSAIFQLSSFLNSRELG
mgnify:CR=1 FL=1